MKSKRARLATVCVVFFAIFASSCARPNVRSAIYDGFGANYSLLKPAPGRPTPSDPQYATNDFQYLPGAITVPFIYKSRDDVRHLSAVWRTNEPGDECYPSPALYTLRDVLPLPRLPVTVEYVFDTRNFLLPTTRDAVTLAKSDLSLGNKDLRFLRRISISFTNVSAYAVSDAMLDRAKADIFRPSRCRDFFYKRKGVVQIESILAGDVFIEIDKVEGASVDLNKIKARIYRAISRRIEGRSLFFAASGVPVLGPTSTSLTATR